MKNDPLGIDALFYLQPPSRLTVDAWAEKHRTMPSAHAIPGPLRVAEHECARAWMRAATVPETRKITIQAPPQVGKSVAMECIAGFVTEDPCPIIWALPTELLAVDFARQRLNPMLHATTILRSAYNVGSRKGNDAMLFKSFFNGATLTVAFAGSESQLAARTARLIVIDEVDRLPMTSEGSALGLLQARVSTFARNSLIVEASSPTWSATSNIAAEYKASDQRKAFLQCPHCHEWQPVEFFMKDYSCARVDWDKENDRHDPESARLFCGLCGAIWTELDRLKAVTSPGGIRWYQTREFECECSSGVMQKPLHERRWQYDERHLVGYALCKTCGKRGVSAVHAGFQCSKLVAQHETVVGMARRFVATFDEAPEARTEFMNLFLGEAADPIELASTVDRHELAERLVRVPALLPAAVLFVTAGCDVQHDRLEILVLGWGEAERCWVLDYKVLPGNPEEPEVWASLWQYLSEKTFDCDVLGDGKPSWRHAIIAACVDSGDGGTSQRVYSFIKSAQNVKKCWWATKGHPDRGGKWEPPVPPIKLQATRATNFLPVMLGTNAIKQRLYERLKITNPAAPGYIALNAEVCSDAWLSQLTAEHLKITTRNGFRSGRYEKKRTGAANEALDCWVMAYAALQLMIERKGFTFERHAERIRYAIMPPPSPSRSSGPVIGDFMSR